MQDEDFQTQPSSVSHEASGLPFLQIQTSMVSDTKQAFNISEASEEVIELIC